MGVMLVRKAKCGLQGSAGLPHPSVFPGHTETLLEGGRATRGRTLLRTLSPGTYLSHLDSNLGSACFSFVN